MRKRHAFLQTGGSRGMLQQRDIQRITRQTSILRSGNLRQILDFFNIQNSLYEAIIFLYLFQFNSEFPVSNNRSGFCNFDQRNEIFSIFIRKKFLRKERHHRRHRAIQHSAKIG